MSKDKIRKALYSPGYGAGWSTWHDRERRTQQEFMLFHPNRALELSYPGFHVPVY